VRVGKQLDKLEFEQRKNIPDYPFPLFNHSVKKRNALYAVAAVKTGSPGFCFSYFYYLIFSYLIFSYLIFFSFIFSYLLLSYLIFSYLSLAFSRQLPANSGL